MLREIKHSLEQQSTEVNQATRRLRSMSTWLREREKKVIKLEAAAFQYSHEVKHDSDMHNLDQSSILESEPPTPMTDRKTFDIFSSPDSELEKMSDELDEDFSRLSFN